MTRKLSQKRAVRALLGAAVLLAPMAAFGWSERASFETRIHGHDFSRVSLESSEECSLKVQVRFDAPADGYKSASAARSFYRFQVRTKLEGGRALLTRVFSNSAPGARAYTYVHDTRADGCWAKLPPKIIGIDVEGCRGAGCTPRPFEGASPTE
jgi:hypothetical protein